MYAITDSISKEIEINRSKFIAILFFVKSTDEVMDALNFVKKQYKDANHYCYAYIINNVRKSSDDGEPGGTAGVPIMEVLNKNELNYILCVVVRYFGGIKLGSGGLVRAYMTTTNTAIKNSKKLLITKGFKVSLFIPYGEKEKFERIIGDSLCTYEYGNDINCIVLCESEIKDKICSYYSPYLIEEVEIFK